MSDAWTWIQTELDLLDSAGLGRQLRRRESPPVEGRIQIDGQQLLNLGSNDYLGLAADSRVVDAVKRFAGYHGWGAGASPLVNGRGALHAELELRLAQLEGMEAALLFPTGFAANVGVISALLDQDSIVFSDAKNHASIIDGIRLSRSQCIVFRHRDVSDLEQKIAQHRPVSRRLIVTDSVFSMDGDLADLGSLVDLAEKFDAMLLIDEAHGTGVFGEQGGGVHEHLGIRSSNLLIVGTLSKALGSLGGFVAGPQPVIRWLWNRARSYMFSTATPEVVCAATLAALDVVKSEPHRRIELLDTARWMRHELKLLGWDPGESESQIIPIFLGESQAAVELSARLWKRGFFAPAIRPPSVPPGESLLRLSLSWQHDRDSLGSFLEELGHSPQGAQR